MPRPAGRTTRCTKADANERLRQGEAFLYVAEIVLGETVELGKDDINLSAVSASLSVLAGIAVADAACCSRLGRRYRGQDHRQAVDLVRTVQPHGPALANDLDRLLNLKDGAHYGTLGVAEPEARRASEWAKRMAATARELFDDTPR